MARSDLDHGAAPVSAHRDTDTNADVSSDGKRLRHGFRPLHFFVNYTRDVSGGIANPDLDYDAAQASADADTDTNANVSSDSGPVVPASARHAPSFTPNLTWAEASQASTLITTLPHRRQTPTLTNTDVSTDGGLQRHDFRPSRFVVYSAGPAGGGAASCDLNHDVAA